MPQKALAVAMPQKRRGDAMHRPAVLAVHCMRTMTGEPPALTAVWRS